MLHHKLRAATTLLTGDIEHERLASLINSMADGVIAVDKHMKIAIYNGAALSILDSNGTITGKTVGSVFKPFDKHNKHVEVHELIRDVKTAFSSRDFVLKYDDGSVINLYLSIAPVRLGYGRKGTEGYVLLIRDITHEKSLEEERNEFISVVSHELRTPIAIAEGNISNALFVAKQTGDIDKIISALNAAHQQVIFLSEMMNDLSTLSRAERGKLVVDVQPINVHHFIHDLAKEYRPDAEKKDLFLHTSTSPHLELLYSAPLYVQEILQNFITNALKYTEKGGVTIGAKKAQNGVTFYVSDTGIGISKPEQARVFDKFFRSEDYRTRNTSGTGLGLYITIKLARLLKADVSLKSDLNKGSTFTIFVPNLKTSR